MEGLFRQVLRMALELGALQLGRVAIDGSKLKANASRHKAMSYRRMQDEERRLREQVRRLFEQAEAVDRAEDAEYGPDRRGDELPTELARREERLRRIREAKRALEERTRAEAEAEGKSEEEAKQVKPEAKAQYSFTDPESRIMKGPDGFVQGYNAQVAVEPVLQLIVGQAVTQQGNDKKQLLPMIEKVKQQSGQQPSAVLADSGYVSEKNLWELAQRGVEAHLAVGRSKHNQPPPACPRGRIPKSTSLLERMRRKLQTVAGRAIYARRKAIVEPVFGQIKQRQGFRQFLLSCVFAEIVQIHVPAFYRHPECRLTSIRRADYHRAAQLLYGLLHSNESTPVSSKVSRRFRAAFWLSLKPMSCVCCPAQRQERVAPCARMSAFVQSAAYLVKAH